MLRITKENQNVLPAKFADEAKFLFAKITKQNTILIY